MAARLPQYDRPGSRRGRKWSSAPTVTTRPVRSCTVRFTPMVAKLLSCANASVRRVRRRTGRYRSPADAISVPGLFC